MVEGPVKHRRFKRRTVRNVLLASMGVLVLGALALTGGYFYRERAEKVQEQALETVQQEASAFAQKDRRKTIMDADIQRAKELLG